MDTQAQENDFAAFEAKVEASPVEITEEKEAVAEASDDAGETDAATDEGDDRGEDPDEEEEKPKPKKQASDRIKELSRKNRSLEERLAKLENNVLPTNESPDNSSERVKPDPNDLDKYPLGSLDDRYIEDMIEHVADAKTAKALESVLHREQEAVAQAEAEKQMTVLRSKANDLAERGSELHDDYDTVVVERGLRGEYPLTQTTFEAIADADHGAAILYTLATDKAEALRVAAMSPYQQLKYVAEKDGALGTKPPARLPKAGNPPQTQVKGSGTKTSISPDTTDFAAFERLADASARRR